MTDATVDQRDALRVQLEAIVGREPDSSLLSVRHRRVHDVQFSEVLVPVGELTHAAISILKLGQSCDVYVGAAPRSGPECDVPRVWCLWIDVDDQSALEQLRSFEPQPGIVIQTSTEDHKLAIWRLRDPVGREEAWRANGRLAALLRSDLGIAAPVMGVRAAGTLNFKHDPPSPVFATRLEATVFAFEELLATVPKLTRAALLVAKSATPSRLLLRLRRWCNSAFDAGAANS